MNINKDEKVIGIIMIDRSCCLYYNLKKIWRLRQNTENKQIKT